MPIPNVFHTQSAARALFQLRQNGAAAHRFDVYSAVKVVFSVDHTCLRNHAIVGLELSINRHAISSLA